MIQFDRARRLIAELDAGGVLSGPAVARALARAPLFQNVAYPLALPPLLIDTGAVEHVRTLTERYVELLEKVVRLYRSRADVRLFFGLGSQADELIDAEGPIERAIAICRLDGYVDDAGALHVLENNADCPAGTVFTPRLNGIVRGLIEPICEPESSLPMDSGDPFTELLARRSAGGSAIVLQQRGRANVESHEIAKALEARGVSCAVGDPRDLSLTGDGLVFGRRRLDLVWNKINMSAWLELVGESPDVVDTLTRAVSHTAGPVMLNSFGARHVAETKTSLALLHAPAFHDAFTGSERELIDSLVPWTVRLDRGCTAAFDGRDWLLEDVVNERQHDLVLKQRYDIRGDGVTVGNAVDRHEWQSAVQAAWNSGAVLQRYIKPCRYPVIRAGDEAPSDLNVSLDSFMFDGRLSGLGAKASAGAKVNLFQGGSKLAVMAMPES